MNSKYPTIFLLLIISLITSGCAKVKNLPELLTLKARSEEVEMQDAYIEEQEKYFEKLFNALMDETIESGQTKKKVLSEFGEPIAIYKVEDNEDISEQWIYRRPITYFKTPKVHLLFNNDGKLASWKVIDPPS